MAAGCSCCDRADGGPGPGPARPRPCLRWGRRRSAAAPSPAPPVHAAPRPRLSGRRPSRGPGHGPPRDDSQRQRRRAHAEGRSALAAWRWRPPPAIRVSGGWLVGRLGRFGRLGRLDDSDDSTTWMTDGSDVSCRPRPDAAPAQSADGCAAAHPSPRGPVGHAPLHRLLGLAESQVGEAAGCRLGWRQRKRGWDGGSCRGAKHPASAAGQASGTDAQLG